MYSLREIQANQYHIEVMDDSSNDGLERFSIDSNYFAITLILVLVLLRFEIG